MDLLTVSLIFLGVIALLVILGILGSFFTVETAQVAIVQRLGKFARVAGPGLNWKTPYIETVVRRLSMKVQQFGSSSGDKNPKTMCSFRFRVSIQYKVIPEER